MEHGTRTDAPVDNGNEIGESTYRIFRGQSAKRRHAATINIKRANREEIEEQPVRRLGGVRNMLRPCCMVRHRVESWRVVLGKGGVSVLAVQTLLEAVDPMVCELEGGQEWGWRDLHRLPIEAAFI